MTANKQIRGTAEIRMASLLRAEGGGSARGRSALIKDDKLDEPQRQKYQRDSSFALKVQIKALTIGVCKPTAED